MRYVRSTRFRRLFIIAIILAPIIAIGGLAFSLNLETQDGFCASCHTEPESTFYASSVDRSGDPANLASSHAQKDPSVHCIDCHGGLDPLPRARTFVSIAMVDTLRFYSGHYSQPAKLTSPIPDQNCLHCHRSAVQAPGFDNHFHNMLSDPAAPQIACTDCHPGHQEASASEKYITRRVVYPHCNDCHTKMGKGPTNLQ